MYAFLVHYIVLFNQQQPGEVTTIALCCKHWSYSSGERSRPQLNKDNMLFCFESWLSLWIEIQIAKTNQVSENVKTQIKQHTEGKIHCIEGSEIHYQTELLTNSRSETRRPPADYDETEQAQLRELAEDNNNQPVTCKFSYFTSCYNCFSLIIIVGACK